MTEQLAFKQIFRNRRTVDGDKAFAASPAFPMHQTGDQFLAGPDSPVTRIEASLGATCSAIRTNWPITGSR